LNEEQVGASALGAILNRALDLKQEPVIFAPRADAPTSKLSWSSFQYYSLLAGNTVYGNWLKLMGSQEAV